MCATEVLPDRPPQNVIDREMSRINSGEDPMNPFLFDLGDSLSSDWNLCVQKFFFLDFWAAVNAHLYEGTQIPSCYQRREAFVEVYNIHMAHLKKTWQEQQRPLDQTRKDRKRKHSMRNSRISTVRHCSFLHLLISRPILDLPKSPRCCSDLASSTFHILGPINHENRFCWHQL